MFYFVLTFVFLTELTERLAPEWAPGSSNSDLGSSSRRLVTPKLSLVASVGFLAYILYGLSALLARTFFLLLNLNSFLWPSKSFYST